MKKHYRIPLLVLSFALCGGAFLYYAHQYSNIPLLAENETYTIHLGDKISVTDKQLSYGGETQTVKGRIVIPDGGSYYGREFTAKEHGRYNVVYEAYFGHHLESKTITYICQRRSTDYFEVNDSASIDFGEYRYNTNKFSHQGVILDVKNGAEIKFTEPLDMNDFMVEQHVEPGKTFKDASTGKDANSLIDFIVDPSEQMTYDFAGITIKLTDTEDSDNFVEIRVKESGFSDYLAGALSYAKVGFSGGFMGGWAYNWQTGIPGDGKFDNSGTGLAMSFKGQTYQDILHSGQFLLDYSNKRFYTYPGSLSHNQVFFMNDLDYSDFYKANGWKGFTNGKCYLSITPFNFTNSKGRIIVKSVGKFDFTEEEMPDTVKPEINIDYKTYSRSNLPHAMVGEYYPVFNSSVSDNYDADLNVNVAVTYYDSVNNQNIDVTIQDNKFLVNKAGTYYINYTATDRSGNVADPISLRVDTVNTFDDIVLTLAENERQAEVLESISIPSLDDVSTSGGIGDIDLSYELVDPHNEVVEIKNNSFTPDLVGDYKVIYTGVDYLGHSGTKTYTIHVQGLTEPRIIGSINLPKAMILGFTYELDQVQAVETLNDEVRVFDTEVLVNGEPYNDSFIASGTEVVIKYTARGNSGTISKTYTVPVVDVSDATNIIDQSKYFYGNMSVAMNRDDVTLSCDGDATTTFINKLDSSNFAVNLEKVDGYANFSEIKFTLIDVQNSAIRVTIAVDLEHKTLSLPGFENLSYAVSTTSNEFSISFNDLTNKVFDTLGNAVSPIVYDDSGNEFNGFPKGVYLEMSLSGVRGHTEVKVTKINNQALGYKEGSGDEGRPTIRLDDSFITIQSFGNNFYYPTFDAYDVFSEIDSATITIAKPEGPALKGDNKMTDTFVIQNYGRYNITYQASDTAGNNAKVANVVYVYDDVNPELSVNKLSKDKYKVGDVVEIPKYTVSDNLNKYYVDVILILPSNEMRILTHDDNGDITYALIDTSLYNSTFIVNDHSFRTEMKGRHKLRYVAYDDEFNTTMVELVFYVE